MLVILSAAALGLSIISAHLLTSRVPRSRVYTPLALLFFCNAFTEVASLLVEPVMIENYPMTVRLFAFSVEPLNLMLAPLFWIYVRGLTAKRNIVWRAKDYLHFVPSVMGIFIPILALTLGREEFMALFESPRLHTSQHQLALIWLIKIVQVVVLIQIAVYVVLIIRRLASYRTALTELFASTEHLELSWIRGLSVFLAAYVVLTVVAEFSNNQYSIELWESLLDFCVLWFVAAWGLRQLPELAKELEASKLENHVGGKYENSALSEERLVRLAQKIELSMQQDKLYRDADLSLRSLAKQINELPNYVSQALNRSIGESFFDFVNRWRIDDSKQKLTSTEDTVLAIAEATGFNSRSSFYNAFKKHTGQTPTVYRKLKKSRVSEN